ncbi:MAG: metallophosphoesterase [Nanoarchaeota archaeon]
MGIEYIGKCLLIEEKGENIVVIGDLHLGYEEALNRSGVYVTREMYKEMMGEMDGVFDKIRDNGNANMTSKGVYDNEGLRVTDKGEKDKQIIDNNTKNEKKVVDKIILLGDVKHSFSGNLRQEWNDVLGVINYLKEKCSELVILRGNHDNYLINIAKQGEIDVVESYIWKEYCFIHGDVEREEMNTNGVGCWVIGHAHPAIFLEDGTTREKYKCFLIGEYRKKKIIVVPSFFSLIVGSNVREGVNVPWEFDLDKFDVKVVNGLGVLDFGKLDNLK